MIAHIARGTHPVKDLQAVHGLWKRAGHSSKILDIVLAPVGESELCGLFRWGGDCVRSKMKERKKEEEMPAVFLYST